MTATDGEERATRQARGHRIEREVARELARRGANIVEMNFRARRGEIDIVAEDGGALAFVEVRSGRSGGPVEPSQTVDGEKKRHIALATREYLTSRAIPETTPVRFDIVAVTTAGDEAATVLEIRWIRGAFTLADVPAWRAGGGKGRGRG